MKKLIPFNLLLFLVFFSFQSFAQKDSKAREVLDAMSAKYQSMNGFTANFDFSTSDGTGTSDKQSGNIAVKGDQYRLKLPDQEIFNNGKIVWTLIVTETYKEVTINEVTQMEGEITPLNIYTIYEKGFDYRLKGDKQIQGKTAQVVELVAQEASAPFQRVDLLINKATKDLLGWEIYDGSGGIFSYAMRDLKGNPSLAEGYFTFAEKDYPGVEVIDLR